MPPEEYDIVATLNQALSQAAAEIGAHSVSVLLMDRDQSIRSVYSWPDSAVPVPAEFPAGEAWSNDRVSAESALGQLLNRNGAVTGAFLLVRWPELYWKVALAFGFASAETQARISGQLSTTLRLAALAIWEADELRRMRRDLRVVNERLGHRKTVERAKGLLQSRHGWSEQQAYEHLRKLSRQRRKPMADTAQELLRISRGT